MTSMCALKVLTTPATGYDQTSKLLKSGSDTTPHRLTHLGIQLSHFGEIELGHALKLARRSQLIIERRPF